MPKLPTAYIGIDPGQSGGIAIIDKFQVQVSPMPTTERDIWKWLLETTVEYIVIRALIEKVHSMPKQGVVSSFKFGMGYGVLRMALTGLGIPFEEVTPQRWIKALEIPYRKKTETKTQFKNRLKAKAQQMYPGVDVTLKTADALLIATYCQRKYEKGI